MLNKLILERDFDVMKDEDYFPDPLLLMLRDEGCSSFVRDSRCNKYIKLDDFNSITKKVFDVEEEVIYTNITQTKVEKVVKFGDIYMTLSLLTADTDKARKAMNYARGYSYTNTDEEEREMREAVRSIASSKLEDFRFINYMIIYHSEKSDKVDAFVEEYDKYKYDEIIVDANDAVFTIGSNSQGLFLQKFFMNNSSYRGDIIKNNYNDDFESVYNDMVKFFNSENNGLCMLKGLPGTGKTSLLMHLTTLSNKLNKRFILVPSSFTSSLASPGFLTFAVNNFQNSVLLIEDAEEALEARGNGNNSAVTNILNISDGILGKLLRTKIVTTVNKDQSIDKALLRKGRLVLEYNFKELSTEKSNKLLKSLGKDFTTNKPMTLANIYNINSEDEIKQEEKKSSPRLGFK
jgi:hypothetical protein